MKRWTLLFSLVLALLLAGGSTMALAAPSAERVDVIIGFNRSPGAAEEGLVRSFGGDIRFTYRLIPAIAASVPESALFGLSHHPLVTVVEPDVAVQAIDAELDSSWGVNRIGAGSVHDSGNKGDQVRVAILDTGVDYNHPDLAANYRGGYDFVNNDADPMDDNGHGTHVAGIIAALDNSQGVVGVAPEVELYALKVLDSRGSGSFSGIIAALDWVCGEFGSPPRAQITNNSYGSPDYPGDLVKMAFDFAYDLWGVLNIAAAGNTGIASGVGDNVLYPARFASVMAVAATDAGDLRADFSSTGADLELAAPGVSVWSTYLSGSYAYGTGTSMACPHVTGTAALVVAGGITDSNGDGFVNDEVRARLVSTALDLGDAGRDTQYGWGLVDAKAAVLGTPEPPQDKIMSVIDLETGIYSGRGRSKTYTPQSTFAAGETVVLRVRLMADGQPLANAAVEITIAGPESVTLSTAPSDANGLAEGIWRTLKAGRKGQPGTLPGTYTATVTGVSAGGYTWDGVTLSINFTVH